MQADKTRLQERLKIFTTFDKLNIKVVCKIHRFLIIVPPTAKPRYWTQTQINVTHLCFRYAV